VNPKRTALGSKPSLRCMTEGLPAQIRQKYNGFLIAYGLFYDTGSSSVYITPIDRMLIVNAELERRWKEATVI